MSATYTNQNGKITYEDSVVTGIASQAAAECYGLTGMAHKNVGSGITNFFKGTNASKGVEITTDGSNDVVVKLYVTAKYGVSLPAVAENVIDKVKYTIEKDTGLHVKSVDIGVQSIQV